MDAKTKKLILILGDTLILVGALALTLLIRYPQADFAAQMGTHWPRFIFIFIIFISTIYINSLYDLNIHPSSRKFLNKTFNTIIAAGLISVIYFYISISSEIAPRTNLVIFLSIFLALFYSWRLINGKISRSLAKSGLAIIGDNRASQHLREELIKNMGAGYHLELTVKNEAGFPELASQVVAGKIKTIVLCDDFNSKETGTFLLSLLPMQVSVLSYPDFYEVLTGKIPVETIDASWFLDNLKESHRNYFQALKRMLDLLVSIFIFSVSIFIWPLIAIAIKIESRGPVFFRQERLGRQGQRFTIIKFRTMKQENNNQELTTLADKRITRLGNILRKTRLDELPQIVNIMKGEMSFVGPRPERPELVAELEEAIPFYNMRLIVKPGLTGWDQVSGEYHSPSKEDTLKKLQNDLFYIKNRSLFLDFVIFLKTIATVFGRGGR